MNTSASMMARPMRFRFTYSPPATGTPMSSVPLRPSADDDRTADRQRREAVLPRAVEVLDGVLAAAGIHRVAVRQERLAAQLLDHIHHRAGVVRAQKADVALLAKMHLDGDKLAVHVNLANPAF